MPEIKKTVSLVLMVMALEILYITISGKIKVVLLTEKK